MSYREQYAAIEETVYSLEVALDNAKAAGNDDVIGFVEDALTVARDAMAALEPQADEEWADEEAYERREYERAV